MSQIVRMFIKEALAQGSLINEKREDAKKGGRASRGETQKSATEVPPRRGGRQEKEASDDKSQQQLEAYIGAIVSFANSNVTNLETLHEFVNRGDIVFDFAWVDDLHETLAGAAAIDQTYGQSGNGSPNLALVTAAGIIAQSDVNTFNTFLNRFINESTRRKRILKEWTPKFIKSMITAPDNNAMKAVMKQNIIDAIQSEPANLAKKSDEIVNGTVSIELKDSAGNVVSKTLRRAIVTDAFDILKTIKISDMEDLGGDGFKKFAQELLDIRMSAAKKPKTLYANWVRTNRDKPLSTLFGKSITSSSDLMAMTFRDTNASAFATKLAAAFDETALDATFREVAGEAAQTAVKKPLVSAETRAAARELGGETVDALSAAGKGTYRSILPGFAKGIAWTLAGATSLAALATIDSAEDSNILPLENAGATRYAMALNSYFTKEARTRFAADMRLVIDDAASDFLNPNEVQDLRTYMSYITSANVVQPSFAEAR